MKKLLLAIFIILPLSGCTVHGNKSLNDENHQT
ncbi:lipoprotein, partial [Escherichia coli]